MDIKMKEMLKYMDESLGIKPKVNPLAKRYLDKLPVYIHEKYSLCSTNLFNREIILAYLNNEKELSVQQTEKQVQQIKNLLNQNVVVVLKTVQAYNRRRLIEKGINFIVPGTQLYMPDLLIDLRETYVNPKAKTKTGTLLPSAQFLLIYHLIHKKQKWNLEEYPFKEIAKKLGYTAMAITNAIDNLKHFGLIKIEGGKEKFIRFNYKRKEIWDLITEQNLLVNPVLKTVFIDKKPVGLFLLHSNTSALHEYTDINQSKQEYFAIEKSDFYSLQKRNELVNLNDQEGKYALEVWKYNPITLLDNCLNDKKVVDPISLYLSLKDNQDERIEIALDQILENLIWLKD